MVSEPRMSSRNRLRSIDRAQVGDAACLIPARRDAPELLDQGVGSAADVRENLMEMWRINRMLGGVPALTRHLYPLLLREGRAQRIVDVGTGSGEMAILIARWAARNGLPLSVYPLDWAWRHLAVAGANAEGAAGVHLVQADVNALPFARDGVDYVISSLFLHHFAPDAVIRLLRDLYERARRGIVMSDLVRGVLPLIAFRAVQPVFARHPLTRHDGALSIQRAYTPPELLVLAREAGIETAQVYRHFPFRMTLVAVKPNV